MVGARLRRAGGERGRKQRPEDRADGRHPNVGGTFEIDAHAQDEGEFAINAASTFKG